MHPLLAAFCHPLLDICNRSIWLALRQNRMIYLQEVFQVDAGKLDPMPATRWRKRMKATQTASAWLEIDMVGLRKTLERKGKGWAIFELVQNAWDEDSTEVAVTLT